MMFREYSKSFAGNLLNSIVFLGHDPGAGFVNSFILDMHHSIEVRSNIKLKRSKNTTNQNTKADNKNNKEAVMYTFLYHSRLSKIYGLQNAMQEAKSKKK